METPRQTFRFQERFYLPSGARLTLMCTDNLVLEHTQFSAVNKYMW